MDGSSLNNDNAVVRSSELRGGMSNPVGPQ